MTRLLTTHDIADQLGTSYENARKVLLRAGYQPVHVIGRNNLWSKQQLSDLLQRRKWKAQTPPIHRMGAKKSRNQVRSIWSARSAARTNEVEGF